MLKSSGAVVIRWLLADKADISCAEVFFVSISIDRGTAYILDTRCAAMTGCVIIFCGQCIIHA